MNAHTVWWLTLLALIKDCSCSQSNPFVLQNHTLTAKEGSCVEIICIKTEGGQNIYDHGSWFWIKDPIWIEKEGFIGTIVYSIDEKRHVSPLFKDRVHYSTSGPGKRFNILICNLNKSDSGSYAFRFEGLEKWITKPQANLTVVENKCPIMFEKPPVVVENQEVNLKCSTLSSCPSNPKIDSIVQRPSTALSEPPNSPHDSNMTLRSITYSFKTNWMDNGIEFSCQTSDNEDKYLVRKINLTVEHSPQDVRAVTSSEEVKEKDPVTLTCSAKGHPNVTFSWFKNDKKLNFAGPEMKFTSADVSHSGSYYCQAENKYGTKNSSILNITVVYAPEVNIQKLPETIKEGDRASLTCNVKRSQPPPQSFHWLKDGVTVAEIQTYVFTSIQQTQSGTYTCTATNTVGAGTSESFNLAVQYKPRSSRVSLYGTYDKNEVSVNSSITFNCDTSAEPLPWYSWFSYNQSNPSDRKFFSNEKTFSLKLVQRTDEACYTCNASNSIGEGNSSEPACIRVRFPPTNLQLFMDTKVREGHNLTINCSAESFPTSTFMLKRLNQSLEWQDIKITQPSNNIFKHSFTATPAHAGSYVCIASNSENTTKSEERKLVVEYFPKDVKGSPSPELVVKENDTFSLECSAHSNPPVKLFTWIKDGDSQFNKNTQHYKVASASPSDSGKYHCRAENAIGTGNSQKIEVKIKYAPKNTAIKRGKEVLLHDGTRSVELSCRSKGYPPAKYHWYSKTKGQVSEGQNFTVHSDKAEAYYCVAKNEMGQKSSDLIVPFNDTFMRKVLPMLLICLFLFLIIIIIIVAKRDKIRSIQQGAANTRPFGGFLAGWTGDRRSNTESEMGLVGPFRSRDDLLTDQPCRPNARQHQLRPDVTSASNINTVYCTVKPPQVQQAPSAQKPARQQAGQKEDDSLNYASLHFQKRQKEQEDAIYSEVSKPLSKPTKEKEGGVSDYENVTAVNAATFFNLYDSDSDTSEDEEEVSYTQVNIRQQRTKTNTNSSEDTTEYSQVKI